MKNVDWRKCIHHFRQNSPERVVYLTFDDGPDIDTTPRVLEALNRYGHKATFFMIGTQVLKKPQLAQQVVQEGHAVGNHSYDHSFHTFFKQKNALVDWIQKGHQVIQQTVKKEPVGFRSPAGVRTPPLASALSELKYPWLHWNVRFYDAVWPWKTKRAKRALDRLVSGDMILLHDRQRESHRREFLSTLDDFLEGLCQRGLRGEAITPSLVEGLRHPNKELMLDE